MTPPQQAATAEIRVGLTVGQDPTPFIISPSHMIITGQTGQGKGVLDEAIATAWRGQKFIVFVTKDAEEQFKGWPRHSPFYKQPDTSDWRALRDLIEVSEQDRTLSKDEQAILGQMSPGTQTFEDILAKIDDEITLRKEKKKTASKSFNALFLLGEYLRKLIKEKGSHEMAGTLSLKPGINVMDISKMSLSLQGAVVGATLWEIYYNHRDTAGIIMEAGKILPYGKNSPALEPAKMITQEGRVKNNWLIFDLQHLKGLHVDVKPNVKTYFLGAQMHKNEIKRTRDALEMTPDMTPTVDQIKGLQIGQFWVIHKSKVTLIYVKPIWLDEKTAVQIARNPEFVNEVIKNKDKYRWVDDGGPLEPDDNTLRFGTGSKKELTGTHGDAAYVKSMVVPSPVEELMQREVEGLRKDIDEVKGQVKALTAERDALQQKVIDLTMRVGELLPKAELFDKINSLVAGSEFYIPDADLDAQEQESAVEPVPATESPTQPTNGHMEKLSESDLTGQIVMLILDKEFQDVLEERDIHRLLVKYYNVVKKFTRFENRLRDALRTLQMRKYGLVESKGRGRWAPTEKAKNLRHEDVIA